MAPLYVFYGDDFTGSTDVLEQLAIAGVPAVLFLGPPSEEELRRFPGMLAFGVAGESRSRSPAWMSERLPDVFERLRTAGAAVVHYKVCSTFDSSPTHGSIGRATEIGLEVFAPRFVPVVVGAPHLRRFVWEGMLFASARDAVIHRIDRHPMNRHPVTPMREPDLRRHLARQTTVPIGLIGNEALHSVSDASSALEAELSAGMRVVLFDTTGEDTLRVIGRALWREAKSEPLFAVGSSGLTAALIAGWRDDGIELETASRRVGETLNGPLLVISGSCSAATAGQVRWALANGFNGFSVDPERLTNDAERGTYTEALVEGAVASLERGEDAVLYTALGGPTGRMGDDQLGAALGRLLEQVLARIPVSRVVLCGGDTSSHAVQQLGLMALSWSGSVETGAPVCRAHFHEQSARRLELVLKGGQVGSEDFFARARKAESLP